jgi:hypothetical protein
MSVAINTLAQRAQERLVAQRDMHPRHHHQHREADVAQERDRLVVGLDDPGAGLAERDPGDQLADDDREDHLAGSRHQRAKGARDDQHRELSETCHRSGVTIL